MKKKFKIASIVTALATLFASPAMALADGPLVVTQTNDQGWVFNRDTTTQTPYEFNEDDASLGEGSLYVLPITNTDTSGNPDRLDKFVAELPLNVPVDTFNSVSYDFLIAGNGDSADANQFYLNVYATLPDPETHPHYNCRFDYVPTSGSTSIFTTASFNDTTVATNVADRSGDSLTCPDTLAEMPAGSSISFLSLNVGDTSLNDTGLAGYLDNVVVDIDANARTYDFEPTITVANKDACKNGGWATSNTPVYKNQGQCVSSFAKEKAKGNPVTNFLNNLF